VCIVKNSSEKHTMKRSKTSVNQQAVCRDREREAEAECKQVEDERSDANIKKKHTWR